MAYPTQKYLQENYTYDAESGILYRKRKTTQDTPAGTTWTTGYVVTKIKGTFYKVHRLIWILLYGDNPPTIIDHINGDKSDNRLCNLRACEHSQNLWNARKPKNNTSGYKGVKMHKKSGKWYGEVRGNGERRITRLCETKDEANQLLIRIRADLHGDFANNG